LESKTQYAVPIVRWAIAKSVYERRTRCRGERNEKMRLCIRRKMRLPR